MNTRKDLIAKQVDLMEEILQKAKVNIVTCGSCGSVLLHKTNHEEDLKCCYCNYESELSDFPDLLYTGIEDSSIFED